MAHSLSGSHGPSPSSASPPAYPYLIIVVVDDSGGIGGFIPAVTLPLLLLRSRGGRSHQRTFPPGPPFLPQVAQEGQLGLEQRAGQESVDRVTLCLTRAFLGLQLARLEGPGKWGTNLPRHHLVNAASH